MTGENSSPPRPFSETRARWAILTGYERFEQVIATVLSLVIAAVIVIALFQLLHQVLPLLVSGAVNLLDPEVFHALFGSIMTLLIAMEFRHSIIRVALRHQGIIQVKTVLLIALLALSRKFLILDVSGTNAATIAALASATLVLGIVYWLLRDREDRDGAESEPGTDKDSR
ncbi:MAG TPA: phosphate-starvation-inducible PsiE family protein [Candidatus Binatia bacterium]